MQLLQWQRGGICCWEGGPVQPLQWQRGRVGPATLQGFRSCGSEGLVDSNDLLGLLLLLLLLGPFPFSGPC